ncbi:MAG: TraB/GumN family protein [Erysipelotrichaceae bacterium]|nr:TraB/GumN family protein [Erysipelotrichaceae bacterium]
MNENIVKVRYEDKDIYLVRTAHVSKNSVEDVKSCIEEVGPDAICIELDEDRYKRMEDVDSYRDQDIAKVIKEKRVGFLLVNIILSSFQRRMARSLDTDTGGEMMEGIRQSKERNIPLVLADRPIRTTFSRIWNKLGFSEKVKLLTTIVSSVFDNEEISEEELAALKESDALEAALNEVGKQFPIMKKILVDERDAYLSHKIKNAPGKKIVAIIGAAHTKGIIDNLENDTDITALEDVSKKKGLGSLIKWLIPALIIFMIVYTLINNREVGLEQIKSWILWNGTLSAFGTLLALGHPLSILTAFIMAPITSLNPLLAAGWFAGLVEAIVRKPKVRDFEDIAVDTATVKGFWKNRVTRILLIVVFANIFSSIATFISGAGILSSFLQLFK